MLVAWQRTRPKLERMTLDDLGPRIAILGPPGAGKSTLARAVGRKLGLPVVHLDQLQHYPDTDWQMRPEAEFIALHDEAIAQSCWLIDGNYSRCLPRRLDRATGVIRIDISTLTSLYRYLRRSWFETGRAGALVGGRDSVKWLMIHHIIVTKRRGRASADQIYAALTQPKVQLATPHALADFYAREELER